LTKTDEVRYRGLVGLFDVLFGRPSTEPEGDANTHDRATIEAALSAARGGRPLTSAVLTQTQVAIESIHRTYLERNGGKPRTEWRAEDAANYYVLATKLTAIGHPQHCGWPFDSDLREVVLPYLRARSSYGSDLWVCLAAIQPALLHGDVTLAKSLYRRIAGDRFLADLARRWATDASVWFAVGREERATNEWLGAVDEWAPWNEPCEIPDHRRWLLLLSIFPSIANDPRLTLAGPRSSVLVGPENARDWHAVDRTSVDQKLEWLRERGHRAELRAYLAGGRTGSAALERFVGSHRAALERYGIVAWDVGRAVALVRSGRVMRWFDDDEAWARLEVFGELARRTYPSWEAYGEDYALGFRFFDPELEEHGHDRCARWLATSPKSPWRKVPFGGR
jgi:hypothetical protein